MGSSRLLYALARDGFLPSSLATISERYRVPRRAILVHAAAGGLLACAGNFTALALVSGGAFCIVYIGVCAAAWRLQVLNVGSGPSMKMRGGSLIPVVGILGLLAILFTLRLGEWLAIGCTAVVACILYSARRSGRQS